MRGILFAVLVIAVVAGGAFQLSRAYFSDIETSTNNTFQAGTLDLKIGNASYYNGERSTETSWEKSDLNGQLFFNFQDIKPASWGEDTVTLRVNTNEAWACYEIKLTKNDDFTCTGPELKDDPSCQEPNTNLFDGDLAQQVEMVFWLDDGDNVLEDNEVASIFAKGSLDQAINGLKGPIADSVKNILSQPAGTPLKGNQDYFLGKAWCFGTLTLNPVAQDNKTDGSVNNPTINPGIECFGSLVNNAAQSDIVNGDITFTAIQARNNSGYICPATAPALKLLETLSVDSHNPAGITSLNTLTSGKNYKIVIEGTWLNRGGHDTVDADFVSYDSFATPGMDGDPSWTIFGLTDTGHLLDTQVNNAFVDWGSYTSSHQYSTAMPGTGSPVSFRIFDGVPETNTQNLGWYSDNSGSETINIYELP